MGLSSELDSQVGAMEGGVFASLVYIALNPRPHADEPLQGGDQIRHIPSLENKPLTS